LKYLRKHGCPWNELTCKYATKFGHFECVDYLNKHNCYWIPKEKIVRNITVVISYLKYNLQIIVPVTKTIGELKELAQHSFDVVEPFELLVDMNPNWILKENLPIKKKNCP